jgi:hypothetical protein
MSDRVHVDLVPDEIIRSTASIRFTLPARVDTRELGKLIDVRGVQGRILASRRKNEFRWSAEEALPPGRHRITFEALTDQRFCKLPEEFTEAVLARMG